ncbi:MAG: helix-turn-helix transcriptional regulator [Clostridia bacterium]|nr:helix-turn-helix transcriptional regulator [Clostridia bacterium]
MNNDKKITAQGIDFSYSVHKATKSLSISHCHDSYEILFVADGKGRYLIEGAEFSLRPRTLVLIKPFEYHCVEINADSNYERYVIHFSNNSVVKEVISNLEKLADSENGESGTFFAPDSISQSVVSLFDRFFEAEHLLGEDREIFFKLLLSELIVLLSLAGNEKIAHDECDLGTRLAKYINEYLERDISLDILAKRFFVSKYYLCRAFKKYSGVSIHSYITHKRVVYAKQLIDSGETASGAAYKVGFGDYSAFYRAYVKVFGKSPASK